MLSVGLPDSQTRAGHLRPWAMIWTCTGDPAGTVDGSRIANDSAWTGMIGVGPGGKGLSGVPTLVEVVTESGVVVVSVSVSESVPGVPKITGIVAMPLLNWKLMGKSAPREVASGSELLSVAESVQPATGWFWALAAIAKTGTGTPTGELGGSIRRTCVGEADSKVRFSSGSIANRRLVGERLERLFRREKPSASWLRLLISVFGKGKRLLMEKAILTYRLFLVQEWTGSIYPNMDFIIDESRFAKGY